MKLQFDVTPQEFGIIEGILANNLTNNCQVWVFGSRAKNSALFNSDLDLALECNHKIASKVLTQLKTDFEKSKLPYRVDVLNIGTVEPYFQEIINKKKILFPFKAKNKVPLLRFSEFSGEWEENRLEDVGSFKSGTGFTEAEQGGESGVPFFKVSDMNLEGNQKVMVLANNYVNDEQIARLNYSPINKKSVIFAKVGAAVFLERKRIAHNFLIDNNMMAFTPTEDIGFIKQWFDTIRLSKYAQVGALPSYNASDLRTIKINLPSIKEQTKIANFLSSIDTKIEQLSKKQALLSAYKKGVMQKIFSETPEWEENKLGDYLVHKSKKNKDGEVDLVLSVSNKKGFITQDEQFGGHQVASKDLSNYKIVEKGEYAYNPSRINVGSIARLKNYNIGIVSPMYVVFKLRQLGAVFFDNLYQTHYFKHLVKIGCSGSVRDSLNFNDMADFLVKIPSLQEQTKIANFLSAIDTKIKQVNKQLDKSKEFKKALLQQMFV